MAQLPNLEYYQLREAQERSAAEAAKDVSVTSIHRAMANRYADRLSELMPTARPRLAIAT